MPAATDVSAWSQVPKVRQSDLEPAAGCPPLHGLLEKQEKQQQQQSHHSWSRKNELQGGR